jgi:hypothetical protein
MSRVPESGWRFTSRTEGFTKSAADWIPLGLSFGTIKPDHVYEHLGFGIEPAARADGSPQDRILIGSVGAGSRGELQLQREASPHPQQVAQKCNRKTMAGKDSHVRSPWPLHRLIQL